MTIASAIAVSVGLALAGCSGNGDAKPTRPASSPARLAPASFVGQTLQYAFGHMRGSVLSLDASESVGLRPASPDPKASETIVIAACYYNDTQLNVMVIPSAGLTAKIRDDARNGKYDSLLTQCRK
jgi:hypothetical protein